MKLLLCSLLSLASLLTMGGCPKAQSLDIDGLGRFVCVRDNDIEGPNLAAAFWLPLVQQEDGTFAYGPAQNLTMQMAQGPGIGAALAGAAASGTQWFGLRPDDVDVAQTGGGGYAEANARASVKNKVHKHHNGGK